MINFQDFTYRYPGRCQNALTNLTLMIELGEFVTVTGASGAGKSTLLGAICGVVPHRVGGVASGDVTVCGKSLRTERPATLAEFVGTLRQPAEEQLLLTTVRAELALPVEFRGWNPVHIATRVEETALLLGIDHLLTRNTIDLSGGERQLVALAAALVAGPSILIVDEPAAQLDPAAAEQLYAALRRLNSQLGTTVVVTQQRVDDHLNDSDRVIALQTGNVAFNGAMTAFGSWVTTQSAVAEPTLVELFSQAGLPERPTTVREARKILSKNMSYDLQLKPPVNDFYAAAVNQVIPDYESQLRLHGVWHEIKNGPVLLRHVTLTVRPGEIVAVLGRNGAGKSTLLQHAVGALEPTRGNITHSPQHQFLAQSVSGHLNGETVRAQAPDEWLKKFDLPARLVHPNDLSAGERQRLALATVFAKVARGSLLCLDEPTRNLDAIAQWQLGQYLQEHVENAGSVLLATHDMEFVARYATRVIVMAAGEIIANASPEELFAASLYFTTITARVLSGQAITPGQGSRLLTAWQLGNSTKTEMQDTVS